MSTMNIGLGANNVVNTENTEENRNFRINRPTSTRISERARRSRGRDFVQERINAREQERLIRESEDARIAQINEHIVNLGSRIATLREELEELEDNEGRIADLGAEDLGRIIESTQRQLNWFQEADREMFGDTALLDARIEELGEALQRYRYAHSVETRIDDATAELGRLESALETTKEMLINTTIQIQMARTEREQLEVEREMMRQQQEMDARMREREREAQEQQAQRMENKSEEELEAAAERAAIRSFATLDTRRNTISALSTTRASMRASATRLRGEANYDMHRQRIANEEIASNARSFNDAERKAFEAEMERFEATGSRGRGRATDHIAPTPPTPMTPGHFFQKNPLAPETFRGRHVATLERGVARTTSNINRAIGAMYRDSKNMQEEQLRIYREKATAHSEEYHEVAEQFPNVQENQQEYEAIDLRL